MQIDSFVFAGPNVAAASASLTVSWEAKEAHVPRGKGSAVGPTDPAAFVGNFAEAQERHLP